MEHRGGTAIEDPVPERITPFGRTEAPTRIAGHDLASAERKAAGRETRVHVLRQRQQGFADVVGAAFTGIENDAVVLIGGERFLPVLPFAAKRDPAETARFEAGRGQFDVDDPLA